MSPETIKIKLKYKGFHSEVIWNEERTYFISIDFSTDIKIGLLVLKTEKAVNWFAERKVIILISGEKVIEEVSTVGEDGVYGIAINYISKLKKEV